MYPARGGDSFTLYPSWYVALGFDKAYPGDVTGVRVRVWADTGEVSTIDRMIYHSPHVVVSEESSSYMLAPVMANMGSAIEVLLTIAILGSATGFYILSTKTKRSSLKCLHKLGLSKLSIPLLCLLMLSSLLMVSAASTPKVYASDLKSQIYVATHAVAYNDTQEFTYATYVANWIDADFATAGIDSDNNAGILTHYETIYGNIDDDESDYMGIAVFHFGHMAGNDNYFDSDDNIVNNTQIDSRTSNYKHYFIWLWTCNQANGPANGMPYAWTDHTSMSSDALMNDDSSGHCFIGFSGSSPAITYRSFNTTTALAYQFIYWFYHSAIFGGTVETALNAASYSTFNLPYYQTPLRTGYFTWWSGDPQHVADWYPGQMHMYGDKHVIIHQ